MMLDVSQLALAIWTPYVMSLALESTLPYDVDFLPPQVSKTCSTQLLSCDISLALGSHADAS